MRSRAFYGGKDKLAEVTQRVSVSLRERRAGVDSRPLTAHCAAGPLDTAPVIPRHGETSSRVLSARGQTTASHEGRGSSTFRLLGFAIVIMDVSINVCFNAQP